MQKRPLTCHYEDATRIPEKLPLPAIAA